MREVEAAAPGAGDVDDAKRPHVTRGRVFALGAAAALAVVCGAIAADGEVPGWEASVFDAINGLPDWLEAPMWVFQLAGLLFAPLVVAAVALLLRRVRLALALVAVVPLKLVVEKAVVKQLVERERPGTTICELDTSCANFRDAPLEGLSFVSGHAIIAWAIVALVWPWATASWRSIAVAVAMLNGVARIYLGAHNPLDVVGGAGVGIALGVALTMIAGAPAGAATRA